MIEDQTKPYLSVCAIYRDEAPYLREWLEFHRLVGVERFFLYDNLSIDGHREVLGPYVDAGIVVLHDWPISYMAQRPAYRHCLDSHRDDSRWIAFIDIDEFLFSPTGQTLPEVLRDYEEAPGVGVYWALFGTSGHRKQPEGLVTESYLHRMNPDRPGDFPYRKRKFMKVIVDPRRTERARGAHAFIYTEGTAVDENKQPVEGGSSEQLSYERLRINHYFTKSEEEHLERKSRIRVAEGVTTPIADNPGRWRLLDEELNEVRDESITVYVPELRRRLGLERAQSIRS
jgi:hypothetical protein